VPKILGKYSWVLLTQLWIIPSSDVVQFAMVELVYEKKKEVAIIYTHPLLLEDLPDLYEVYYF
jgi:hypothetical protein